MYKHFNFQTDGACSGYMRHVSPFLIFPVFLSNPDIRREWMCDYHWGWTQSFIIMAYAICGGVCCRRKWWGSESYQWSNEMRGTHTHTQMCNDKLGNIMTQITDFAFHLISHFFFIMLFSGFKVTPTTHTARQFACVDISGSLHGNTDKQIRPALVGVFQASLA